MRTSGVTHDTTLLRRLNTRATLQALRQGGIQTLSQLARSAGLSRQTAEVALDDLAERGLAQEVAPTEGAAGRPARRFRFVADAGHVLGIDIGPRRVLAMVTNLDGQTVAEERHAVDEHLPAADRLALAERAAVACAERAGTGRGGMWAASAGTSGIVDRSGRVTLSTLIPGWTGLDLGDQVSRWFGCPGFAANDANLAAAAEHWRGSARHVQDVVYILSGHRAGHGLLLGGQVHAGRSGAAGELGQLPLVGWDDPSVVLAREGLTAEQVFEAARGGSAHALDIVGQLAHGLARGASALVLGLDPDLVVLGGSFSRAGDLLLDPLRGHLDTMCRNPPEVALSTFGEESVAMGAVRRALDHVESQRLDL